MNFLWFLLFLTVPVLVHLFNFRRAKRLFFTNVKFIKKVSTETKSKTRLKHLLILTSRVLAFLFLISAFIISLVQFERGEVNENNSMGSVYFDNSLSSVGNEIGDDIGIVEQIILQGESNRGTLLLNGFSSFSNREHLRADILDELSVASVSYVGRYIDEVLNRIDVIGSVYLLSDFQESTSYDLDRIKNDSLRDYYLLFNENEDVRNVYVDSVWVGKNIDDYSTNILSCTLGRTANFTEGSVVVKLIDDNGNQISSVIAKLENELEVTFTLPENSLKSFFKIQLSGDDVDYDNEFYFILDKKINPRILVLSKSDNRYLTNIFGNTELFDLIISDTDEIDYETLKTIDLVVINDYFQIPEGLIRQNVEETFFLLIPADSIDIENYNSEAGFSINYNENVEFQEIRVNKGNPLMNGVYKKISEGTTFPLARKKYEASSAHERILTLRDGSTFLGSNVNKSVYFLFAPLRDEFTELPNHSIFLPLMYRIAEESLESDQSLFTYPNSYLEMRGLSPNLPPRIVSKGLEFIPEFTVRNQTGLIKVPSNLTPGFYHVLQGEDTIKSFGLNIPKNESTFEGPSFEEFEDFFLDVPHVKVFSMSDDYEGAMLPAQDGNGLWKYALILALIFLMVETLFHRYLK